MDPIMPTPEAIISHFLGARLTPQTPCLEVRKIGVNTYTIFPRSPYNDSKFHFRLFNVVANNLMRDTFVAEIKDSDVAPNALIIVEIAKTKLAEYNAILAAEKAKSELMQNKEILAVESVHSLKHLTEAFTMYAMKYYYMSPNNSPNTALKDAGSEKRVLKLEKQPFNCVPAKPPLPSSILNPLQRIWMYTYGKTPDGKMPDEKKAEKMRKEEIPKEFRKSEFFSKKSFGSHKLHQNLLPIISVEHAIHAIENNEENKCEQLAHTVARHIHSMYITSDLSTLSPLMPPDPKKIDKAGSLEVIGNYFEFLISQFLAHYGQSDEASLNSFLVIWKKYFNAITPTNKEKQTNIELLQAACHPFFIHIYHGATNTLDRFLLSRFQFFCNLLTQERFNNLSLNIEYALSSVDLTVTKSTRSLEFILSGEMMSSIARQIVTINQDNTIHLVIENIVQRNMITMPPWTPGIRIGISCPNPENATAKLVQQQLERCGFKVNFDVS